MAERIFDFPKPLYDNFLKDTIGNGKTIDELVGLK